MTSPKAASLIVSNDAPRGDARSLPDGGARPLVLGSASPRRRELLAQIGVTPDHIDPPDIDEDMRGAESPRDYARRIAREKTEAIRGRRPGALVLCADTVVALGRRILGKPDDRRAARRVLTMLSGRRHKVISAIALYDPTRERLSERLVETRVAFKRLSVGEIDAYLDSEEWRGKAGGYAIQGSAAAFSPWINGSYSNVVGLPLSETAALLNGAGYPLWRRRDQSDSGA